MQILSKGKYYGLKAKEHGFNGVILSEYAYHVPRTDWHYHENPYFMYVLQGDLYDVNKIQKSTCPSGSLLFHNWQEQHYNEKESLNARGFHIEFDRKWFEEKQLDISLWSGSTKLDHPILHQLVGKIYYEFHLADAFSEIGIETSLLTLCEQVETSLAANSDKKPFWIGLLKEIVNDSTGSWSLEMLSKELGLHPVHLSRSIPKYLGVTLSEYMRQTKIKKSLNYLTNTQHSLTEISYICGFYDQSHFIRLFKSYFGISPKKYRMTVSV